MNFVAHCLVAYRSGQPSPEYGMGAALPDLMAMAAIRCEYSKLSPEMQLGLACHYEADRVFHADEAFSRGTQALRDEGQRQGLSKGASRAVAHAGWELLLDGALVDRTIALDLFHQAIAHAGSAAAGLDSDAASRWAQLLDRLGHYQPWVHYGDPEFVAEALCRRLEGRPRLAFPRDQVGVAASVLSGSQPQVSVEAELVVDRVVEALRVGRGEQMP
jgi:hypothetical protein